MPTTKQKRVAAPPPTPTPTPTPTQEEQIEIGPQELLKAALHKAWITIRQEDKLTKATMDGVVQLLKLHREYSPLEDVPKKYRVEWLTQTELASLDE